MNGVAVIYDMTNDIAVICGIVISAVVSWSSLAMFATVTLPATRKPAQHDRDGGAAQPQCSIRNDVPPAPRPGSCRDRKRPVAPVR